MSDLPFSAPPSHRALIVRGIVREKQAVAGHVRDLADLMNKHCGDRQPNWMQRVQADSLRARVGAEDSSEPSGLAFRLVP